jgi:small subunit ribosomal protein S16
VGATKRPSYRVVAIDSRRPRDGRALEILGFYDPLTRPATVQIDAARLAAWIGKGASPSDTVAKLIKLNPSAPSATAMAEVAAPKPKRSRKATAKAAEAAAKEATPEVPEPTAEAEPIAQAEPTAETEAEPAAEADE